MPKPDTMSHERWSQIREKTQRWLAGGVSVANCVARWAEYDTDRGVRAADVESWQETPKARRHRLLVRYMWRVDHLRREKRRKAAATRHAKKMAQAFHDNLAEAKAEYARATHPSERIERYWEIERMEGKISPVFMRRKDKLPDEVLNMRMIG